MSVLFSWLGSTDVRACLAQKAGKKFGAPVPSILQMEDFTNAVILSNWRNDKRNPEKDPSEEECLQAIDWLEAQSKTQIQFKRVDLDNPIDVASIFTSSLSAVEDFQKDDDAQDYVFNVSSGTWAMRSRFRCRRRWRSACWSAPRFSPC